MNDNFADKWVHRGDKEIDVLFGFFCYYIAFNFLYDEYHQANVSEDGERETIHSFLDGNKDIFSSYNPYSQLNNDSRLLGDINNMRTDTCYNNFNNIIDDYNNYILNGDRIRHYNRLFQNIYTVRCNLFHGAKSMSNNDSVLIHDCCMVLSSFLHALLKCCYYKFPSWSNQDDKKRIGSLPSFNLTQSCHNANYIIQEK